ncbi:hypothetical protein AAEY27_03330 [Kosakonia sp. BYX6]|uniref:HNH endonuclease n=1 Tax=Kosakonia calanthes TaxID=3139408 RepID=A0ABZ3B6I7_9ENTR
MDKKFGILRNKIKRSQSYVMNHLTNNHQAKLCVLCGSEAEITREHVIPQWAFESDPDKFLISTTNNQSSSYIKTTIPACRTCNSELLGAFEDYLKRMLTVKHLNNLNGYDYDCIIWWLQYLGFKLQVMDLQNRFLRYKGKQYIPFLAQIPVAMFWGDVDTTPNHTYRILRKARRNLMSKWKDGKYNSLMIFKSKNESFTFFHKVDEFIFIQMPQLKLAFFFFFNKEFEKHQQAHKESMEIIKRIWDSEAET